MSESIDLSLIKKKNKSAGKKSIYISDTNSRIKFVEPFGKFCNDNKLSQKSVVEQLIIRFLQDNKSL